MKRPAEVNSNGPLNQGSQKKKNTGLNAFEDILEATQKRSDEEISASVQYKHLKNCLSNAQNSVNNLEKPFIDEEKDVAVEIEARFGTISKKGPNTSFAPALQFADFLRLKNYLETCPEMDTYDEEKIDYSYVAGSDKTSQIRITTEDEMGLDGAYSILRKMKVDHVDLAFPSMTHDVRVAVALEVTLNEQDLPQNFNKSNYRGYRKKKRTVYQKPDEPWKVELTVVESIQSSDLMTSGKAKNQQGDITYEAEIELDKEASGWFQEKKPLAQTEKFQELITNFFKFIRKILEIIGGPQNVGSEVQNNVNVAPFPEVKEILVSSDTIVSKLKERVGRCFGEESIDNFPGSMPVTFGRRHISTVMANDYMISEKTDGVRYMFLICPEGSFIINRSYNFYKVAFDPLKTLFSKDNTSTLLDGELVRHHDGRVIFLVFDVVTINGTPFYQEGFKNRYQAIGQQAIGPYRAWKQQPGNSSGLPFDIMQKIFHPKENIENFFKSILKEGHHKYYRDEKRYHKTDGLIITPTTPYALRKAVTLFKWKYAELQSIDFVATLGTDVDHFHLLIGVDSGEQECYYTTFPPEDLYRLKTDWRKHHGNAQRAIIECLYDTRIGMWRYYAMRPDKNVPNYITTMCDTWLGIAENVTEAELIKAFKQKTSPLQYQQQHQKQQQQQHQQHQQHHQQQHQQQPISSKQVLALPSSTSTTSTTSTSTTSAPNQEAFEPTNSELGTLKF